MGWLSRLFAPRAHYEAVTPSRQRKLYRTGLAPNLMVDQAGRPLREQARHLERNHDLFKGILRTLVNNVVGPTGIGIEPQPRQKDGTVHEDYAAALRRAWWDWQRAPEVTGRHNWAQVQRLMLRALIRDGESFAQLLSGRIHALDHGTEVPFSLELFEADMVPLDFNDEARSIRQGIELNAWGRTMAAWVYREHPGEKPLMSTRENLKRIPANNLLHLFRPDRLHQVRGVSDFAAVLNRLHDLKEYENAEQVAAKLAASLTLYIKRNNPDGFNPEADRRRRDEEGNAIPREIEFDVGTILDDLQVGEDIGMIDSKRPNSGALTWRQGQLRAIASGIGASYSSISRDYDGTYSSQRQELVEQWIHYAVLADEFCGLLIRPVWEEFVRIAHLSGVAVRPVEVTPNAADDALFVGQSMPWIDPMKEASAWQLLVQSGFASEIEVLRRRGLNPRDVLEQIAYWRSACAEKGVVFTSNPASVPPQKDASAPSDPPPNETGRRGQKTRKESNEQELV